MCTALYCVRTALCTVLFYSMVCMPVAQSLSGVCLQYSTGSPCHCNHCVTVWCCPPGLPPLKFQLGSDGAQSWLLDDVPDQYSATALQPNSTVLAFLCHSHLALQACPLSSSSWARAGPSHGSSRRTWTRTSGSRGDGGAVCAHQGREQPQVRGKGASSDGKGHSSAGGRGEEPLVRERGNLK